MSAGEGEARIPPAERMPLAAPTARAARIAENTAAVRCNVGVPPFDESIPPGHGAVWAAVAFSQPAFAAPATVAQNSTTIGLYEVYELTLTSASRLYANPWTDAVITAILRFPSGNTYTIGGFYYDTNAFKVRFTPRETGAWTWTLSMTGSGSFNTAGRFTAVGSNKKGFMRADPGRPRTFYTEGNGKSFHGIGINDCWYGKYVLDVHDLNVGLDAYFDAWNAAGNNFYRFGFANCADYVFAYAGLNVDNSGKNTYDVDVGKRFDALATKVRALDRKMMVSFVGTGSGFDFNLSDPRIDEPFCTCISTSLTAGALTWTSGN